MNVLIAGAGGNLGRLLVSAFKKQGVDVRRLSFRKEEMDPVRAQLSAVLSGDIAKPEDLVGMCDGVDIVVSVVWVFGDGTAPFTPISEEDLAEVMAEDSLKVSKAYVDVGGPQDLSWNGISEICLTVHNKPVKISGFPLWACRLVLTVLKPFFPQYYGMGELIVYTSMHDLLTAKGGKTYFEDYLRGKFQQGMGLTE